MRIDRQRHAALRLLQERGYRWGGVTWRGPGEIAPAIAAARVAAADASHDVIAGRIEEA